MSRTADRGRAPGRCRVRRRRAVRCLWKWSRATCRRAGAVGRRRSSSIQPAPLPLSRPPLRACPAPRWMWPASCANPSRRVGTRGATSPTRIWSRVPLRVPQRKGSPYRKSTTGWCDLCPISRIKETAIAQPAGRYSCHLIVIACSVRVSHHTKGCQIHIGVWHVVVKGKPRAF